MLATVQLLLHLASMKNHGAGHKAGAHVDSDSTLSPGALGRRDDLISWLMLQLQSVDAQVCMVVFGFLDVTALCFVSMLIVSANTPAPRGY